MSRNPWLNLLPAPPRTAALGAFDPVPDQNFDRRDLGGPAPVDAAQPLLREELDPARFDTGPQVSPEVQAAWEQREREKTDGRVQWDTFHRLLRVNANHAAQAWQLRYRMPLSPHAVVFLFHQPDSATRGTRVTAATRTWHASPEARHPLPLLDKLTAAVSEQLANEQADEQAWNLWWEALPDRSDPDMTADAVYAGLGVSTLDTPAGSFAQHCATAVNELDIPGAFCWLTNPLGTREDLQVMTVERAAANDTGTVSIHSFQALTTDALSSNYPYTPVPARMLFEQSPHAHVLHRMWKLDQALHHADAARLAAARLAAGTVRPTRRRGRPS